METDSLFWPPYPFTGAHTHTHIFKKEMGRRKKFKRKIKAYIFKHWIELGIGVPVYNPSLGGGELGRLKLGSWG